MNPTEAMTAWLRAWSIAVGRRASAPTAFEFIRKTLQDLLGRDPLQMSNEEFGRALLAAGDRSATHYRRFALQRIRSVVAAGAEGTAALAAANRTDIGPGELDVFGALADALGALLPSWMWPVLIAVLGVVLLLILRK